MTQPRPPNERPTAQELASGGDQPVQIAGKPACVCPYCGAGMFVDGTQATGREVVRYVECRNRKCGRRFVTVQPPAKIVREIGNDDDSADGKPALTLVRETA